MCIDDDFIICLNRTMERKKDAVNNNININNLDVHHWLFNWI